MTEWLSRIWRAHPWRTSLLAGLFAWLLSMAFYFSWVMFLPENHYRIDDFLSLCRNPFDRENVNPILYFRLTVPLVIYYLHLPEMSAHVIQFGCSILTMAVLFHVVASKYRPSLALWFVTGMAATTMMQWTNLCPGFPDSVSFLIAVICLYSLPKWSYVPLIFLGALNDERMLFTLPFIVLWKYPGLIDDRDQWKPALLEIACMVGGLVAWLAFRHLLATGVIGEAFERPPTYDAMKKAFTSLTPYGSTWPMWCWNVFAAFRWFWGLLLLALVCGRVGPATNGIFLLCMAIIVLASSAVSDVSRSIGFAFLALACCLRWSVDGCGMDKTEKFVRVMVVLLYATPAGYFVADRMMWLAPPFYKIFREVMAGG